MVRVLGPAHVPTLKRQLAAEAHHEFGSQAANSPFLNQKSKSAFGPRLTRAVVEVNLDQLDHHCRGLKNFYKDIQRLIDGESSLCHFSAYQYVEPNPSSFLFGNERYVL